MKKFITATLVAATVLAPITGVNATVKSQFQDVVDNHVYVDSINYLKENNIASGFSDQTFRPENNITRGEFTKLIVGATVSSIPEAQDCLESNTLPYNDAQEILDGKFAEYICVATTLDIVSGYSDNTYRYNENISVGEASKILANSFDLTDEAVITGFDKHVFEVFTQALLNVGAIPFTVDNHEDLLNRGEMAEFVRNLSQNPDGTNQQSTRVVKLYSTEFITGGEDCGAMNSSIYTNSIPWGHIQPDDLEIISNAHDPSVDILENISIYSVNGFNINSLNTDLKVKFINSDGYYIEIDRKIEVIIENQGSQGPSSCELQHIEAQIKTSAKEAMELMGEEDFEIIVTFDWLQL